jgi:hypothetical protein
MFWNLAAISSPRRNEHGSGFAPSVAGRYNTLADLLGVARLGGLQR